MVRDSAEGTGEVWLDDDQQESWRAIVSLLTTLPAALERDLKRNANLSAFDYLVLASLSEASEQTMQMSDLAARANASLSRLSHVVARLERRGWVRREVCGTDARATNAVLTKSGRDKVVATAPHHAQTVRNLVVDALSRSQLQQLGRAAAKIGQRIEQQTSVPQRAKSH